MNVYDMYDDPRVPLDVLRRGAETYRDIARSHGQRAASHEQMARDAAEDERRYGALADHIDLLLAGRIDEVVRQPLDDDRPFRLMCGVATGKGWPCTRWVWREGDRCWQHQRAET